ncbi:MAG: hypothetical protein B7Y28_22785 [Polaromonas sp. 16-63-31]|nr:MAG: hypothetical protein B7Y60_23295 [Polaromonas sp. 35-63-35]OYZ15046.1 MAG: hypothetical protein B7Y28_22785 [Polaromonas sp. 16-63-31]OZA45851.1 MAG: hypothetical protein B7X88_24075 [Polaromonas sp. 17-63-33]
MFLRFHLCRREPEVISQFIGDMLRVNITAVRHHIKPKIAIFYCLKMYELPGGVTPVTNADDFYFHF